MPRLAPRLSSLGRLFRRGGGQRAGDPSDGLPQEDPLLAVGRRLRQEREARGLNLRQLALETRISTPVLEALERGWRDRGRWRRHHIRDTRQGRSAGPIRCGVHPLRQTAPGVEEVERSGRALSAHVAQT